MANYTKTTIGKENRIELHEKLSLTGAEISLNELPAGANVPVEPDKAIRDTIYPNFGLGGDGDLGDASFSGCSGWRGRSSHT